MSGPTTLDLLTALCRAAPDYGLASSLMSRSTFVCTHPELPGVLAITPCDAKEYARSLLSDAHTESATKVREALYRLGSMKREECIPFLDKFAACHILGHLGLAQADTSIQQLTASHQALWSSMSRFKRGEKVAETESTVDAAHLIPNVDLNPESWAPADAIWQETTRGNLPERSSEGVVGLQAYFERFCSIDVGAPLAFVSVCNYTQVDIGKIDGALVRASERHRTLFRPEEILAIVEIKKSPPERSPLGFSFSLKDIGQAAGYAECLLQSLPSAVRRSVLFVVTDLHHIQLFTVARSSDVCAPVAYTKTPVRADAGHVLESLVYLNADTIVSPLHARAPAGLIPVLTGPLLGFGATSQTFGTSWKSADAVVKVTNRGPEGCVLMKHEADILRLLNTSVEDVSGIPRLLAVLDQDLENILITQRHLELILVDWGFAVHPANVSLPYEGTLRTASDAVLEKLGSGIEVFEVTPSDDLVSLVRSAVLLNNAEDLPPRTNYGDLREFWSHYKVPALAAALAVDYDGLARCFSNWHHL
eukprot:m51a1_g3202 hypothetical protein (535) ;mRNA; f:12225-14362